MATFGILTNIINIRTFTLMGLKDAMTVSFILLSISDFTLSVVSLGMGIGGILYVDEYMFREWFQFAPYILGLFSTNLFIPVSAVVALNTSFISVARCMCVSLPLYFKHVFKRRTSVVFMLVSFVFCAVLYTPVFSYMGVVDKLDPVRNRSRPSAWVSPDRKYIKDVVWNILGMGVPLLTFATIIASTVLMARALTKSQRFRSANAQSYQSDSTTAESSRKKEKISNKNSGKLVGKERQIVKQVVVISLVYILCNTPKIVFILTTIFVQEFATGTRLNYLYVTVSNVRMIFEIINSVISLPIYYAYNSKFRQMCGIKLCVGRK